MKNAVILSLIAISLFAMGIYFLASYSWVNTTSNPIYLFNKPKQVLLNEEKSKELLEWLDTHRSKWSASLTSYAYNVGTIRSEYFDIIVFDRFLVMNYRGFFGKDRSIQIVRNLSEADLKFWKSLFMINTAQQGAAANP